LLLFRCDQSVFGSGGFGRYHVRAVSFGLSVRSTVSAPPLPNV